MFDNLESVKTLIEKWGALPEITNKNDENSLMVAVRYKHIEVVKYLCTQVRPRGTLDIDYECNRNGLTPFSRAVISGDFDIADVLLKQGNAFKGFVNKKENKSIMELATILNN